MFRERLRTARQTFLLRSSGTALFAVSAVTGCGAGTASQLPASAASRASVPLTDRANVVAAEVASDSTRAAGLTATRDGAGMRLRVHPLPVVGDLAEPESLPEVANSAAPVSIAIHKGAPCVSFWSLEGENVVTCRRRGLWAPLRATPPVGTIGQLVVARRQLHAVFSTATTLSVAVYDDDLSSWRTVARRRVAKGSTAAASSTRGGVALLIQRPILNGVVRSVVQVGSESGFRHVAGPLRGRFGPLVSGPAMRGELVAVPETDASVKPWRFYAALVSSPRPARRVRVRAGKGDNVGGVANACGRTWAFWQSQALRPDGNLDTEVRARTLTGPSRDFLVWRGITPAPGPLALIEVAHRPYLLHGEGASNGLSATVRQLPASACAD